MQLLCTLITPRSYIFSAADKVDIVGNREDAPSPVIDEDEKHLPTMSVCKLHQFSNWCKTYYNFTLKYTLPQTLVSDGTSDSGEQRGERSCITGSSGESEREDVDLVMLHCSFKL